MYLFAPEPVWCHPLRVGVGARLIPKMWVAWGYGKSCGYLWMNRASPPGERAHEPDETEDEEERGRCAAQHHLGHEPGEVGASEHDQAVRGQHAERGPHRDQSRGLQARPPGVGGQLG